MRVATLKRIKFKGDVVFLIALGILSYLFIFPRLDYLWWYLVIPFVLVWKWRREHYFVKRTVIDWGIALLLIQMMVTCFVVSDLSFSLPKIAGALFGVLVFYALVGVIDSGEKVKIFCLAFLVGAGLLTLVSFIGMRFSSDPFISQSYSGIERMMGGFRRMTPFIRFGLKGAEEGFNSNAVAGTALLSLPFIILAPFIFRKWGTKWIGRVGRVEKGVKGEVRKEKKVQELDTINLRISEGRRDEIERKKGPMTMERQEERVFKLNVGLKILTGGLVLLFCGILFLTFSMGSWIALLATFWLVAFFTRWNKKWLAVVSLLIFLFIFLPSGVTKKEPQKENWLKRKLELRENIMSVGLGVVKERPWTGIGMNQLRKLTMIEYHRSHAHNHFLHTAAELGIPGLIGYLVILVGAGYMVVMVWRKGRDDFLRWVVLALGAGQFAHFIFGLADSIPLGAKPGIVFWLSLALIAAVYNISFGEEWEMKRRRRNKGERGIKKKGKLVTG